MKEVYLIKRGEEVYSTGAYLKWTGEFWELAGTDEQEYYRGNKVCYNDKGKPYVYVEEKK